MTDLTKNIWFAVFLTEFEMMFIINAFALVTFATILYITLTLFRLGGGFSNPPSGKIVITPTPKEL